jgi:isopentenyldiphosphate isomerase
MSVEEVVDVLDEFGEKTGEIVSKSEAHRRELWHGGAHVWMYNSRGEVLLQLRAADKDMYPNTWDISASGHSHAGDTPITTALREVNEELGLKIDKHQLEFIGVVRTVQRIPDANFTHRVFDCVYIMHAEQFDPADLKLQAEEVSEARWWPIDELEAAMRDPAKSRQLFSPRPFYLFDMAFTEIRKALKQEQTAEMDTD